MRYVSVLLFILTARTASAQDYVRPVVDAPGPPPIRDVDPGVLGAQWLQAIAMTDYEVWIAKDTSKMVSYEVWLETKYGWDPVGEGSGDIHVHARAFGSWEEAELFAELQMLLNDSNLNYRVMSIVPDMQWEYLDTFDSRAEARRFLSELLSIIGDDYVGDIRSVTVIPPALTRK